MTRPNAAHRAPQSTIRSLLSFSYFVKATATLVIAIALALTATSGTYALLNSSRPVTLLPADAATSVTITAGTANLIVNAGTFSTADLYPGEVRALDVTVLTSGSVDLALSVASILGTAADGFTATVAGGSCATAASAVTIGVLGVTATPTTPASLCVRFGLATNAPTTRIGSNTTLTVNLSGAQA